MSGNRALLTNLIRRCDLLAVEAGQIVLLPASGDQATADSWLREHYSEVLAEILATTGRRAFRYHSYDVGRYGSKLGSGITLQFSDEVTEQGYFCCFNVSLTRDRSTRFGKSGDPLPGRQFRASKNTKFTKFWQRSGLPLPRGRSAAFHDYMGNLRGVVLTGCLAEGHNEKLDKDSVEVLSIAFAEIMSALHADSGCGDSAGQQPDSIRTTAGQYPDKTRSRTPDKHPAPAQEPRAFQPISTTGENNYGNKVNGNKGKGNTGNPYPLSPHLSGIYKIDPKHQSIDDWLGDYSRPDPTSSPIH